MTELVTNVIEFMAAKRDMTELYPLCVHAYSGYMYMHEVKDVERRSRNCKPRVSVLTCLYLAIQTLMQL